MPRADLPPADLSRADLPSADLPRFALPRAVPRRTPMARLAVVLALVLAPLSLSACEAVDRARMKLVGVVVDQPEVESAEWVIKEALHAAAEPDAEKGWERFQKILHSNERTTNALNGWRQFGWPRMRRQAKLYLDEQGRFTLRDFKVQQNEGIDFFIESKVRELPTPCSVYIDHANNKLWRIKRCSL